MPTPSNNRNNTARKTGGKAGGRAGRPTNPIAGTKDRTSRVPSSWNAKTVDPTNNRGAGQRPTGGQAGGRAGRPSGRIAGQGTTKPAPKPPAPSVKPSGISAAGRLGRAAVGGAALAAIAGKTAETLGKAADPKQWERVQTELKQRQASYQPPKPQVAKPGQKGAVTPQQSAKTKSETVGSNQPSGTTGGKASSTSAGRPTSQFAGSRDREFNRVRNMGSGSTTTPSTRQTPSSGGVSRGNGGGTTSRSSGGSSNSTYASTMPAVVTRSVDAPASRQTGDKQKDMATWAQSNKKLGEALGKRNSERGTSRTTNPLMKDMVESMKKREDGQDQQNGTGKYFGPPSPGKSASNAPSASNKFNTKDSLYTPKAKLSDDEERRRRAMGMKNNYGQYSG